MKDQSHTASDLARVPPVSTPRSDGARFFELYDGGATYWLVAIDLDHAKNMIRKAGIEFGYPSQPLDSATGLRWSECTPEQVAKLRRCHTEDERGVIPLAQTNIGDWFCTEW